MSERVSNFDEARAHLDARPDSAANDARKIMDLELALHAERLQLRLPYLHGDRNDRRGAHEFLERIIADGRRCLQVRVDGEYVVHQQALDALKAADALVVSWANRGSHTFDLVRPEAEKLINACEAALAQLKCDACGRDVWSLDDASREWVQCGCGTIRWRYGRG